MTESGSVYDFAESNVAEFYVCVDIVPEPFADATHSVYWSRIARPAPWPPVIGQALELVLLLRDIEGDRERVPGGGTVTSAVTEIDEATWPDVVRGS